jgi:predicted nucleic acid-binding protein
VILVDTAPLISLIDAGQRETHARCAQLYQTLPKPLLTTWCSFTEAMYLLHRIDGWLAQERLWQFVERQALLLHTPSLLEQQRIRQLMEQYQDIPMDLADASLVAAAETLGIRQVFTLDSDFYVYRMHGREAFDVVGLP